jgi:hypothetical protein
MEITTLAIWISLVLTAVGLIAIVLFGIRSIINGKFRMSSLIAMAVPAVVFAISYVISSGAAEPLAAAAVLTSLILLVLGVLTVLVMGLRGLVGF